MISRKFYNFAVPNDIYREPEEQKLLLSLERLFKWLSLIMRTFAEENYLKAIYHLSYGGAKNVSTNALAEQLNTKPASVTDMIRKLSDKDLVKYEKYQGVTLSQAGKEHALKVIRKHRLWETFLVDKLQFKWDEVHAVAEQLEHIQSPLLVERLDQFLGYPEFDPHGEPIPNAQGHYKTKFNTLIQHMKPKQSGVVVSVKSTDPQFLKYLDKMGILIGTQFTVLDKISFDESVQIQIKENTQIISISKEVATNIYCSVNKV